MVDVPLPAVMGDVAVTVDKDAETDPTFTTTLAVCVIATELIVAETVFVPAAVALRVPVATPLASVVPTGCGNVLPAGGGAATGTGARCRPRWATWPGPWTRTRTPSRRSRRRWRSG